MKRTLHILYSALLVLCVAACSKNLDINDNPNQATKPPINGSLAATTYNTAFNIYRVSNITSYYMQYLASPRAASAADVYEATDYSGTWKNLYHNMTDIKDMIQQGRDLGAAQHVGVGEVLMALNLEMVNDLWGSAPYTQAFNVEYLQPAYTADDSLYTYCLQLLDDGITQLKRTDAKYVLDPVKDLLHGGNSAAWIKTAYTLKARILNHISKKSKYDAAAILAAIANGYTNNSDDAQLTQFQSLSPWNQAVVNNNSNLLDGWMSDHFIKALNGATFGVADPRLPLITDTTIYGDYRGTVNGAGGTSSNTDGKLCYLSDRGFYSKPGAPLMVATNAECRFIEAEAAFRSNDKARAYSAYLAGIKAHMDKLGVDPAKRDAYTNNPIVAVGAANITLDLILKEKYVAQFLMPDAWNDGRRYDYQYKNFNLPVGALLGNAFIRRLAYPDSEKGRNSKNVPTVQLTDHVWWDQ
ncbi:SusD/RagB family nutrient-binding outer membrane lipoprotein [Chitinophaga vietnamensis]|uniref:SusD/RagB family nutrient-binding outer membrane lipoprotein n=1 Tax=Chitinophaga vietnamensis TaxID=2593957 RepID=UPI001178483F|nr:SusD/RagB family nutrient-binding outer membrane lipoprotein [Chitinophaga vietnamensis]